MNKPDLCKCMVLPIDYSMLESADDLKHFGPDRWNGEITLERCKLCGTLWLRHFIEYEGFTSSGRWCKASVTEHELDGLTADNALDHIASQPRYLYGGSFFNSTGQVGTEPFDPTYWVRTR